MTVRGEAPKGPCRIRWVWRPSEITLTSGAEEEEISSGFRPDGHVRGLVVTDELGFAELPFRPQEGRFPDFPHLWVEGPEGLQRYFGCVNLRKMGDEPWTFEIDPDRATVEVLAKDAAGAPVAGVEVMVEITRWRLDDPWGMASYLYGEDMDLVGLAARGRTAANGKLRLEVLAGTEFEWRATIPGHTFEGRVNHFLQRDEVHLLEITPPGPESKIAGRVFLADGQPVPESVGLRLWVKSPDGRMPGWAGVEADGSFRITGLEPGNYRLGYGMPPIGPAFGEFETTTGIHDLEIHLPPLSDLIVRAVDSRDRAPIDSFRVTYSAGSTSGWTFSVGEYFILQHFGGLWEELSLHRDGYLSQTIDLRPLTAAQKAGLEVVLVPARMIQLTLRDSREEAVDWDTVLWLTNDSSEEIEPGEWADDDISWIWRSAPKTALSFQFLDENGNPLSAVVEIPAGPEDRQRDVPLEMAADNDR